MERSNYQKNWYEKNKERKNEQSRLWYQANKEAHSKRNKIWRENNRERMKELSKEWYKNNKERSAINAKLWYKNNTERKRLSCKLWYEKNKKRTADRQRHKRKTNPSYRLLMNLRRRTLLALNGKCKSANTMTLLGIPNIDFLWNHLEKLFKPGMTRENHGKWHLDHIKPCSSFDLTKPEEQAECFHYTNLQPLWASENLSKGNRIS